MFKKIYKEIDEIRGKSNGIYERIDVLSKTFRNHYDVMSTNIHSINICMPDVKRMQQTIESQQRTIEQLTNALRDKYEHGLFIFSDDGKIPMVIRNGKELTNELTSYFGIDWTHGEIPNIRIEQLAGTYHDLEV